jgi:arabinogalactan oligomer/maltooligosaccharide transport system permease protein
MTAAADVKTQAPARARTRGRGSREKPSPAKQALLQALCIFIAFTVLFPVVWILSMAVDPRGLSRPDGLNLIPPGATLDSFRQVIAQPTRNPVSFVELAFNSFKIAVGSALFAVGIGVSAAYAFSRIDFRGRSVLMLAVLGVLMLPAVATLTPLFVILNSITVDFPEPIGTFNLRNSLLGVGLAIVSGALPFAIWNLKGYLDTIPRELEEAAAVDGATRNQTFIRIILPLATPALAVTAFLGFIGGWTEFYFSWMFLTKPEDFTLSMALYSMVGQYARTTPWSLLAAFSILVAIPPAVVYFFAQRYITSGLAIGGVKG